MASSYSTSARFILQGTGDNNNTWGVKLNVAALQLVDDNVNGRQPLALSGNHVLAAANGVTDEQRMAFLDVTGGTGGQIGIGNASKGYFVRNGATGPVGLAAGGGAVFSFGPGDAGPVFSDGSNVYGLQIANLSLRDYIAAQVTGGGNLPNPIGNLNKALVCRDHGTGPFWTGDLITAEVLGRWRGPDQSRVPACQPGRGHLHRPGERPEALPEQQQVPVQQRRGDLQ